MDLHYEIDDELPEGADPEGLSPEDRAYVEALKVRDREVREHEEAHFRLGGEHAQKPDFVVTRGPDGREYAVEGETKIDVTPVAGKPRETVRKAQQVRYAALSVRKPSSADHAVADLAARMERNPRASQERQLESLQIAPAFLAAARGAAALVSSGAGMTGSITRGASAATGAFIASRNANAATTTEEQIRAQNELNRSLYDLRRTARELDQSFQDFSKNIEQFSPRTITARAQSQERELMASQRRAQKLDERMAEFVQLQTDASIILGDIKTIIQKALLDVMVPFFNWIKEMLRNFKYSLDQILRVTIVAINLTIATLNDQFFGGFATPILNLLKRILQAIVDLGGPEENNALDQFVDEFLNMAMPLEGVPVYTGKKPKKNRFAGPKKPPIQDNRDLGQRWRDIQRAMQNNQNGGE